MLFKEQWLFLEEVTKLETHRDYIIIAIVYTLRFVETCKNLRIFFWCTITIGMQKIVTFGENSKHCCAETIQNNIHDSVRERNKAFGRKENIFGRTSWDFIDP